MQFLVPIQRIFILSRGFLQRGLHELHLCIRMGAMILPTGNCVIGPEKRDYRNVAQANADQKASFQKELNRYCEFSSVRSCSGYSGHFAFGSKLIIVCGGAVGTMGRRNGLSEAL